MDNLGKNRIREWRDKRGLTLEQLADLTKISASYLQRMEVGTRNVSLKNLSTISAALNVSQAELVPNPSEGKRKVPLVGHVGAGAETNLFGEGQGPFDMVDAPEGSTDKTVAVEIRGQSLGPVLDRWIAFYDDVHEPPRPELLNELCLVWLPDDRVLVKQLAKGQLPNRYNLLSNTEPPIYDVEVKWAAKVRALMPR